MNIMKNIKILFIAFVLIGASTFGQTAKQKKADREYNNFSFVKAIKTYEKLIDTSFNGYPYWTTDVWILKVDLVGNILWEESYGGSKNELVKDVFETNSGFIIFSFALSTDFDLLGTPYNTSTSWIFKIDKDGILEWSDFKYGSVSSVVESKEGGFTYTGSGAGLTKIDTLANIEWQHSYNSNYNLTHARSLGQKSDFHYVFDALDNYYSAIVEVDSLGNYITKSRITGLDINSITPLIVLPNNDIVFTISSSSSLNNLSNYYGGIGSDIWIVKLKTFLGQIYGTVLLDINGNCIQDVGESYLSDIILFADDTVSPVLHFSNTDSQGNYVIDVDTIPHFVSIVSPSPYVESSLCISDTQLAFLSSTVSTDTIDFYLQPSILCPLMTVDIAAPFLRRCFSSNYFINYYNNGTVIANNSYVNIKFDSRLQINYTKRVFSYPFKLVI